MVTITILLVLIIIIIIMITHKGETIDCFSPAIAIGGYFFVTILLGLLLIFSFDPLGLSSDVTYRYIYKLTLIGFVSLYLGIFYVYFIVEKLAAKRISKEYLRSDFLFTPGFNAVMSFILISGYIATVLFFVRSGTVPLLAEDKNEARMISMQIPGNGYLQYIMTTMNFYVIFNAIKIKVRGNYSILQSSRYILYIMFTSIFIVYLMTGSRRYSLFLLVYILLVENYLKAYISVKKVFISALLMLALVVGFELYRESSYDSVGLTLLYRSVLYVSNFKNIFTSIPHDVPFQHGKTLLMDFYTILPGKQIDFQSWIKDVTGLSFKGFGVPPTIIGDLYINWGQLGVSLGMFFFGVSLQLAYFCLVKQGPSPFKLVCYIILFESSIKCITSGLSAQLMPLLLQYILLVVIVCMIWLFIDIGNNINRAKAER